MFLQRPVVVILIALPFTSISCLIKPITIFSDFTSDDDLQFFKQTLPWIVDNIGSDITIKYYFKDSGKTSGPRQCVLSQLSRNTYLQATFLNCEANGNPFECIKHLPLNDKALKTCIKLSVNGYVRAADREFRRYKIKSTPAIVLSRKIIFSKEKPEDLLREICLLYPSNKPTGCVQPKPLPNEKPNDEMSSTSATAETEGYGASTKQPVTEKFEPSKIQTTNQVESFTETPTTMKVESSSEQTTMKTVEPSTIQTTTASKVEPSTEQIATTKKVEPSTIQTTKKVESFTESPTTKRVESLSEQITMKTVEPSTIQTTTPSTVESTKQIATTKKFEPSTIKTTKKVESFTESPTTKKVESSSEQTTMKTVEPSTIETTTASKVEPSTEQITTTKKVEPSNEQITTKEEEITTESPTTKNSEKAVEP